MRKLLLILFLFPLFSVAQKDTVIHLYTFGGIHNDLGEDIAATSDSGYVVIGSTSSNSSGNTDAYLLKIDSNCTYQWSKAIGGNNNDWGYSIKETFDKGFIIAASSNSFGNGGYDAVLMKRDSAGNFVWRKTYGGQDWDFAYDVVQTYDSGYVFCGETYNNSKGYSDVYIVKTSPTGDTLWTRTYGGTLVDKGNSLMETSDSNIVVAGIINTLTDSTQIYVIKLARNGTLIWDSIYGNLKYESANSIIEAANGDYVMNGSSNSFSPGGDSDFYLMRTTKDGTIIWSNHYGNPATPGNQNAYDLIEDANGQLINVGFTEEVGAGLKDATIFTIKPGGSWGGLGPTFGSTVNETLKSIAVGMDGTYCAAGNTTSYGYGLEDVLVIKWDTLYLNQDTTISIYNDLIPLNTPEIETNKKTNVYPNPAKNTIAIYTEDFNPNANYQFTLRTIAGKVIQRKKLTQQQTNISITHLAKGMYLYSISENGTLRPFQKLIVQ